LEKNLSCKKDMNGIRVDDEIEHAGTKEDVREWKVILEETLTHASLGLGLEARRCDRRRRRQGPTLLNHLPLRDLGNFTKSGRGSWR
jgi:hypothetical protein